LILLDLALMGTRARMKKRRRKTRVSCILY